MKLAHNKVSSGHSRNMRDANYLTKKSAADMAAIFTLKADLLSLDPPPPPPSRVDPKISTTPTNGVDDEGNVADWKNSRR